MTVPSKSWTVITDGTVDADSPLDETLMTALRDNLVHLEEWIGFSYTAAQDHDHDGVNSKGVVLPTASVGIDALKRMRESLYQKMYGGVTFYSSMGDGLSPSGGGANISGDDADDAWVFFGGASGGTANREFTTPTANSHTQGRHNPIVRMRIKTHTNILQRRMWFGLWDNTFATGSMATDSTPDTFFAGFRFATDVDGTDFWRCVSIDGTGASAEETITTTAIATVTVYTLEVRLTASDVEFYIDNVLVATHSSVVPTSSTGLGIIVQSKSLNSGDDRYVGLATIQSVRES